MDLQPPIISQPMPRPHLLPEWLRIPHALRQNEHEHVLMNAFLTLPLKPAQLQRLRYCRLYLQVENLSEICSIDGSHILRIASDNPCHLQANFPGGSKPDQSAHWSLWRSSLARLFLNNQVPPPPPRPADLALHTPLGSWFPDHSSWRRWPSYATAQELFLLQSDQSRILPREILPHDRHRFSYRRAPQSCRFTPDPPAVPPCPIVQEFHSHLRTPVVNNRTIPGPFTPTPPTSPTDHLTISSYFQALPTWETDLIQGFTRDRKEGAPAHWDRKS